jgi:hypothetical protein
MKTPRVQFPIKVVNGLRALHMEEILDYREAHPSPRALPAGFGSAHGECVVCNTPIEPSARRYSVHMVGGGYILSKDSEDVYKPDSGEMGLCPIGPECAKLLPAEFVRKE